MPKNRSRKPVDASTASVDASTALADGITATTVHGDAEKAPRMACGASQTRLRRSRMPSADIPQPNSARADTDRVSAQSSPQARFDSHVSIAVPYASSHAVHSIYIPCKRIYKPFHHSNPCQTIHPDIPLKYLQTVIEPEMEKLKRKTVGMSPKVTRETFRNRMFLEWTYRNHTDLIIQAIVEMSTVTEIQDTCWVIPKCNGVVRYPTLTPYPGVYIMLDERRLFSTHNVSMLVRNSGNIRKPSNRRPNAALYVRHTCNNKQCWNPDHLKYGTQLQNRRDRSAFDSARFRAKRREKESRKPFHIWFGDRI